MMGCASCTSGVPAAVPHQMRKLLGVLEAMAQEEAEERP